MVVGGQGQFEIGLPPKSLIINQISPPCTTDPFNLSMGLCSQAKAQNCSERSDALNTHENGALLSTSAMIIVTHLLK